MRKIFALLLIILTTLQVKGQDAQFSQYFSASLFLNPGFAGVYNDPSLLLNSRRQVPTNEVLNELTQVSIVFPLKPQGKLEKSIGGIGIMAYNDRSGIDGVFQNNAAFLTYAHNFKFGILSSDIVSVGIQTGYETRSVDYDKLRWGNSFNRYFGYDETIPPPVTEFNSRKNNLIVNAGIMYYYNPDRNYLLYSYSAFSGFSATNLNRPNRSLNTLSEEKAPILWKYNGGVELKFNKLFVTPNLLFQYLRENYQFNAGVSLAYAPEADLYSARGNQLLLGGWYRYKDSFILMGGVKMKTVTIRGSYDFNTKLFIPEKNVEFGRNSFEISVQYSLSGDQSLRKITNPLF